jgi:hypothetical protein
MTKRRDRLTGAAALVTVLVVLALGFHRLGPRANQRAIKADQLRLEDLHSIAQQVYFQNLRQMPMPDALGELPQSAHVSLHDPVTNAPYEYHPKLGTAYELCANFETDSSAREGWNIQPYSPFWNHAKGRFCYRLDAAKMTEY